jgi:hypothetical protein
MGGVAGLPVTVSVTGTESDPPVHVNVTDPLYIPGDAELAPI